MQKAVFNTIKSNTLGNKMHLKVNKTGKDNRYKSYKTKYKQQKNHTKTLKNILLSTKTCTKIHIFLLARKYQT